MQVAGRPAPRPCRHTGPTQPIGCRFAIGGNRKGEGLQIEQIGIVRRVRHVQRARIAVAPGIRHIGGYIDCTPLLDTPRPPSHHPRAPTYRARPAGPQLPPAKPQRRAEAATGCAPQGAGDVYSYRPAAQGCGRATHNWLPPRPTGQKAAQRPMPTNDGGRLATSSRAYRRAGGAATHPATWPPPMPCAAHPDVPDDSAPGSAAPHDQKPPLTRGEPTDPDQPARAPASRLPHPPHPPSPERAAGAVGATRLRSDDHRDAGAAAHERRPT